LGVYEVNLPLLFGRDPYTNIGGFYAHTHLYFKGQGLRERRMWGICTRVCVCLPSVLTPAPGCGSGFGVVITITI